jgi:hypothetical protein
MQPSAATWSSLSAPASHGDTVLATAVRESANAVSRPIARLPSHRTPWDELEEFGWLVSLRQGSNAIDPQIADDLLTHLEEEMTLDYGFETARNQ